MHTYQTILYRFLWIGLAAAILMGCGGRPSEFKQTAGEMKEGPGVFTGKEGEFVVYDDKKGGAFWKNSKENAEETAKETGKVAPATSDQSAEVSPTQSDGRHGSPVYRGRPRRLGDRLYVAARRPLRLGDRRAFSRL